MNLVIHQGALGDWVVTFPLLEALAPMATVAVAADSKARLAARLMPHITPLAIESADWSGLHVADAAPSPRVRELLTSATHVFSFVSTGDDAWSDNIRRLCPTAARLYFIAPRPPATWDAHVCDWHLAQLRAQGWTPPPAGGQRPAEASSASPLAGGQRPADTAGLSHAILHSETLRSIDSAGHCPPASERAHILLHPGSGGREKCWPVDRFEELMLRLRRAGRRVTPILGEVEMDRWPGDVTQRWKEAHGAAVIDSLDVLCDLLLAANFYIGNDSGPTHLAAWLGVPTLALFGPSNATHWAPRGRKAHIVRSHSPSMSYLPLEVVWSALSHHLPRG